MAQATDGELLRHFVDFGDEAAFETIVRRYGPSVLSVSRHVLGTDMATVDDVFQSTFLVLVRNARSIRNADVLGDWLYSVAHRIAVRTKGQLVRRGSRDVNAVDILVDPRTRAFDLDISETLRLLHDELNRLPSRLREPILLCHFEGLTYEAAANRLQCPLGTFKSRLGKGKAVLRSRLTRRGVAVSIALLLLSRSREATAISVERLASSTLRIAVDCRHSSQVPDGLRSLVDSVTVSSSTGIATTSLGLLMAAAIQALTRPRNIRSLRRPMAGLIATMSLLVLFFPGCDTKAFGLASKARLFGRPTLERASRAAGSPSAAHKADHVSLLAIGRHHCGD
jgi:RNA polymerase sigma factor (sigma-70 family)